MPLVVSDQRSPEWHAAHKGKITSSTAAGALGLSPHMSPKKAWRIITGQEVERTNGFIQWGQKHEARARAEYECATGNLVETTGFWIHPTISWLGASPDGFVGEDGMAEFKCPQKKPEDIPGHYLVQMIVQMVVTGREWCDFYAWTESGAFLKRHVLCPIGDGPISAYHMAFNATLMSKLYEFYNLYVVTGNEPPRQKSRKKLSVVGQVTEWIDIPVEVEE